MIMNNGGSPYRPSFYQTKAQRRLLKYTEEGAKDLLIEYALVQASLFEWDIPEELNVPLHHFENCLFWTGTIGVYKKGKNDVLFSPGAPILWDIYSQPKKWTQTLIDPEVTYYDKKEHLQKNEPLLLLPAVPAMLLSEYAKVQYSALISLGQNTVAMRQPVAIGGTNSDITLKYIGASVENGTSYLPQFQHESKRFEDAIQVLDLGAKNFIDPLTGLVDFTDAYMVNLLGVDSISTQKASGVNMAESGSNSTRVKSLRDMGLKIREQWIKKVNDIMDVDIKVSINAEFNRCGDDKINTVSDTNRINTINNG